MSARCEALALRASRREAQRVLQAIAEVSLPPRSPRGAESHAVCPEGSGIDSAAAAGQGEIDVWAEAAIPLLEQSGPLFPPAFKV